MKYYKLLKDTPILCAGAILTYSEGASSASLKDRVFVQPNIVSENPITFHCGGLNTPGWFEEIFEYGGKFYSTQEAAQVAAGFVIEDASTDKAESK